MTATAYADQVGAATHDARAVVELVMADPKPPSSSIATTTDRDRSPATCSMASTRPRSGAGCAPAGISPGGVLPRRGCSGGDPAGYCHACATVKLAVTQGDRQAAGGRCQRRRRRSSRPQT